MFPLPLRVRRLPFREPGAPGLLYQAVARSALHCFRLHWVRLFLLLPSCQRSRPNAALSHIYRPMPPLSTLLLSVAGAAGAACSALPFREPAPVEGWGPLVFSFFPVCYLLLLSRGIPPPFSCGLPPPFFPWATPPLLFFPLRRPGHMHFPLYLFSDWRD